MFRSSPPQNRRKFNLWNQTATDYPLDRTLPELIEAQVELTPDAVAVIFKRRKPSPTATSTPRPNHLAHHHEKPIRRSAPNTPVACLHSSDRSTGYCPSSPIASKPKVTYRALRPRVCRPNAWPHVGRDYQATGC